MSHPPQTASSVDDVSVGFRGSSNYSFPTISTAEDSSTPPPPHKQETRHEQETNSPELPDGLPESMLTRSVVQWFHQTSVFASTSAKTPLKEENWTKMVKAPVVPLYS